MANKRNLVALGTDVRLRYLVASVPAELAGPLVVSLEVKSALFMSRSLDEAFKAFLRAESASARQPVANLRSQGSVSSERQDSLASQVVKISGVRAEVACHYVASHASERPLLPAASFLTVRSISFSSKASVLDSVRGVGWAGACKAPSKMYQVNVQMEKVDCVVHSEMVFAVLRSLPAQLARFEEILLKLRMVQATQKYQTMVVFYSLLQRVGAAGGLEVAAAGEGAERAGVQELCRGGAGA